MTTCQKVKALHKWKRSDKVAARKLILWCQKNWPTLHQAYNTTIVSFAVKGDEIGYDWQQLVDFEKRLVAVCQTDDLLKAAVMMADHIVHVNALAGESNQALITELSDFRARLLAPAGHPFL
jgi:hypothetical protein